MWDASKTRTKSSLDNINHLRTLLLVRRYCFHILDIIGSKKITKRSLKRTTDCATIMFAELKAKRVIFAYNVICDETNNSSKTLKKDELHLCCNYKHSPVIEQIELKFKSYKRRIRKKKKCATSSQL